MNEAERVLSAAGDAGAVIVLVLSTVFIVWMLQRAFIEAIRLWRAAAKERNAIDETHNVILSGLAAKIEDDAKATTGLIDHLTTLTKVMRDFKLDMATSMANVTADRNKKLAAIHTDIKIVPDEVWKQGDPKLETVQMAIQSMLAAHFLDLEDRLFERVDPQNAVQKLAVKTEFEIVKSELNNRISEIVKYLVSIERMVATLKPSDVRMKTGEHTPVDPEPKEDTSKEQD